MACKRKLSYSFLGHEQMLERTRSGISRVNWMKSRVGIGVKFNVAMDSRCSNWVFAVYLSSDDYRGSLEVSVR